MRTMGRKSTVFTLALLSVVCFVGGSISRAGVMESAQMLPDDMLVMLSVESVKDLQAAAEKTSLHGLYKDPAMQPFITDTEQKVRTLIDTTLKEFWQKMNVENPPKEIPYPEGRLVLGVSLFKQAAAVNGDEESGGGMVFRFVAVTDMGSHAEQARQLIRSLSASAVNAGTSVERKDVGGVELNVLVPDDSDAPTLRYGLKDNWLLITGDTSKGVEFTESIVKRMGRSLPGSLADKAGLKAAVRVLGEGQVFTFVNLDAVKSLATAAAGNRVPVPMFIQALGFGNVTGMATSVQIGGQRNQEMVSKSLIGIDGAKTGIPALLADASGPLKLNNRLLTRDAVGFISANYTPVKIFDGINKIIQGFMPMDLNMIAQSGLQATAGEAGQPPVQLRDDVLAQVSGPIFFTWQVQKPYSFTEMTAFLAGLSVQDGARLNAAVGRIHQAFTGGQPDLRREMLNQTLYLLPTGAPSMSMEDEDADAGAPTVQVAQGPQAMAFSVAGDSLVFGPVDQVEQAIRSLGKEPQNPLASDPMFRYAKDSLPSQACVYMYQNDRLNTEMSWTALKQLARDASGEENESWNPMVAVIQKVKDYVDLSKLPEFKAVEKYWGASVGYMQDRPEGLYWESIALRPPQQ